MCITNKVGYSTRKVAKIKARKLSKIRKKRMSVYKCKKCNGFHLTSIKMWFKIILRESERGLNNG